VGRRDGLADLVVLHADGSQARRTIERLSRAGVDGGAIVLLGPVEARAPGRHGDRQTDLGSSLALGGRVVRGALLGMVPGALFGLLVLAVAVGDQPWPALFAGAGGGATLGAGIGVLVALLAAPTMASSWERTFSPLLPGGVAVGVHVANRKTQRRAQRALRRSPGVTVQEVEDLDDLPPRAPVIDEDDPRA
jgi:hypothetical protein